MASKKWGYGSTAEQRWYGQNSCFPFENSSFCLISLLPPLKFLVSYNEIVFSKTWPKNLKSRSQFIEISCTKGYVQRTKQGFICFAFCFCLFCFFNLGIKFFFLIIGKNILIIKHSEKRSIKIISHHPKITTSNIFSDILYVYSLKINTHIYVVCTYVSIIITLPFKLILALCITPYLS